MLILIFNFQKKHSTDFRSVFLKYKAFFIYFSMFISFLALCSPHFTIRIIIAFTGRLPYSRDALRVIVIFRYFPSLLNPIMYALFKKDFQRIFSKTIHGKDVNKNINKSCQWTPVISKRTVESAMLFEAGNCDSPV